MGPLCPSPLPKINQRLPWLYYWRLEYACIIKHNNFYIDLFTTTIFYLSPGILGWKDVPYIWFARLCVPCGQEPLLVRFVHPVHSLPHRCCLALRQRGRGILPQFIVQTPALYKAVRKNRKRELSLLSILHCD